MATRRWDGPLEVELEQADLQSEGFLHVRSQPTLELFNHLEVFHGLDG